MSAAAAARRYTQLVAVVAGLVVTARSGAQEAAGDKPTLDVTSTTLAGWHTGSAGYGELFERLNATGSIGAFRLGLRTDTATFAQ